MEYDEQRLKISRKIRCSLDYNEMVRVLSLLVSDAGLSRQLSGYDVINTTSACKIRGPTILNPLTVLVKQAIGSDHVVHDGRLGNLLGTELTLRREVLSVVVTEMVVRSDSSRFDTGVDEEFGEDGFDLGLTGLEIITSDETLLPLSKLNRAGDEGVLRSTIDERNTFKHGSYSEDGRWRHLFVGFGDGSWETRGRCGHQLKAEQKRHKRMGICTYPKGCRRYR